jgi:putative ABC transport system substrate-binding protein
MMEHLARLRVIVWFVIIVLVGLTLAACGGDDEEKSYTVGAIMQNPTAGETWDAFKATLAEDGYVEGENITYFIEASGPLLAEQVSPDKLDLIFAVGGTFGASETNGLTQAKALAGGTIPIIVAPAAGDPIASGDAESLANPGKNVTGLLMLNADDKRFQLFADMLPEHATQVAIIYDPNHSDAVSQLPKIEAVAEQAGLDLLLFATSGAEPETTEQAFAEIPEDVDGLFMLKVWGTSPRWFEWAFAHGVPSSQDGILLQADLPQSLMAYGPSLVQMGVDGARLADQIFKGTPPGDLPLEYPDFHLTIDLAVSEAIGFEVPDETLSLANDVRRSDISVYASQPMSAASDEITHSEGIGACAGKITTMGGTFTICVTTPCDQLVSGGVITYSDTIDVGACSEEDLVGICSSADFDSYYYDGQASALQIGCGFMSGTWTTAGE